MSSCGDYGSREIASFLDRIASQSGHLTALHGAKVLLKPNLISSRGLALSCSHPQFIAGVAGWLVDQGARISIGDSPAFGNSQSVCRSRGIDQVLEPFGVQIINFSTPVEKRLSCGRKVTIAAEALECDYFIGLPRVKAHNQMYLTLAIKNLFGIVKGVNKAMLHMSCQNNRENFSRIILDLIELLPRQFHVIDGIEVMSESGPLDGVPLQLGWLGASSSAVALDRAVVDILEVDQSKCPLAVTAEKLNLPGADFSKIDFPFDPSSKFYGSGFVVPDSLNPIRFNPFRFFSGMIRRLGLKLKK